MAIITGAIQSAHITYHGSPMGVIDAIQSLVDRGGLAVIPLLILSVITVALILERTRFWWKTHSRASIRRVERMTDLLSKGDDRVESLVATDTTVYGAVVRSLLRNGSGDAAALTAMERVRPRIERYIGALSTMITAGPLLGILGTVTGIIRSFNLLGSQEDIRELHDVSAGIAEALLNTTLGLAIALIAVFPYMIFRGHANRATGRIEALIAAARHGVSATSRETAPARERKRMSNEPPSEPSLPAAHGASR